ncbi:MAG TPA: UDP-N-acetylmuramoyl-L-alanyl-D-glutamate--2,6-diaminopimelate ligase [Xanthomonadaceae bacterium]|nr:UDP-N-acetylmuramoyl-L-alanyl-D-glutamate--2,6-diaminopimelate ligase [Xanthomonadaceae bacterium]
MPLAELLDGMDAGAELSQANVTGLTSNSGKVRQGDAFIALAGASVHGLRFAESAMAAGAAAVVFEAPAPDGLNIPDGAIGVPGLRNKLGAIANRYYGAPSHQLVVIGVTGTNGKTSFVQLLSQALSLHGDIAGSIGTLGAGLVGKVVAGERTTPDVIEVHRLLAEMRDAGASHVAMEVSSHALDQGRVDAVAFDVAVFTNITRDHLDYHGSMQAYGEAKAKLFAWPTLRAAVVNLDDAFGASLHARLPDGLRRIGVSSRDARDAVLRAENVRLGTSGIAFDLAIGEESHTVESRLLGRFNVDNLLAVAGALLALGWPLPVIAASLPQLEPVDGRMNRIGGDGRSPLVVVDYAHTPDALEQALLSLRAHTRGALVCVFGCGGDRDRGKRPQMAAIAERLADRVIVTDDNPRSEDGDAIAAEIVSGFVHPELVRVQRDRTAAIAFAIARATIDDVVLIAGKGHETYQDIAGAQRPFDDMAHARRALGARALHMEDQVSRAHDAQERP